MSRAFVKDNDGDTPEDLPDRPISKHPNFVTATGLRMIEERVRALASERELARLAEEPSNVARIGRELRYWQQRRSTARLVTPDAAAGKVRFGMRVTLQPHAGSALAFTLVGEDEADPAHGRISWASPLAQQLLGREVGDEIVFNDLRYEIAAIEATG